MNAGHVYVLAFDNGTVKVGQTQNAPQRLSSHKSIARGFGLTVTGEWVSPPHAGYRANEDALKAIAASLGGTPTSQEYFSGVDFAAVVEKAQELTFTAPEAGESPEPDAEDPAQPAEPPQMTAREIAIRDDATKSVADAIAYEVTVARQFLDWGGTPGDIYAVKGASRMGDMMQLILTREHEIARHFDTVLAIQRRLTGSDY
jgi:hypothetical protein